MKNDFGYTAYTSEDRNEPGRESLFEALEHAIKSNPNEPALIARDPNSNRKNTQYLSLSFIQLHQEIEAWKKQIRETKVSSAPRVLLWMPQSLPLLAASLALLQLGKEIAICDSKKISKQALNAFNPTVVIASSAVLRQSRKTFGKDIPHLEVKSPKLRLSSNVAVYSPNALISHAKSFGLTVFRKDHNDRTLAIRFDETSLAAIIDDLRKFEQLQNSDTTNAPDTLSLLLNPALGSGTILSNLDLETPSAKKTKNLVHAIHDLGVNRLALTHEEWRELSKHCSKYQIQLPSLKTLIFRNSGPVGIESTQFLQRITPNAKTYSIFGTASTPFAAFNSLEEESPNPPFSLRASFLGNLFPSARKQICLPSKISQSEQNQSETNRIGTLHISGTTTGTIVQYDSSGYNQNELDHSNTGLFAFDNDSDEVWICGSDKLAVKTSFGVFIPARCEPVFEKHPKVERCTLLNLETNGSSRPGILVETNADSLPQNALAESKFKAELLQLGAQQDDTKLILDFFFTESSRIASPHKRTPSRKSLSLRYTFLSKLKAAF